MGRCRLPAWQGDISTIRNFAKLPPEARRYVAVMMKSILEVAYRDGWPADDRDLPNLRYLGVGPDPSQIIKDVPSTRELMALA